MSGFILATILLVLTFKLSHSDTTLRILHTNNFRSSFEAKGKDNKTRGGIARIVEYVNKQKSEHTSVLYFDTMDWFTGSLWYSVHKMGICTAFMNILPVDALGLGEGEMFEGEAKYREKNFWEYINSICEKTILCTNCEIQSNIKGSDCIQKSKIFEFGNARVGVMAYIDGELAPPRFYKIRFTNESEAINQEAEQLARDGVNITIVIGHGDVNFNEEVVSRLKNVDLLIGGHARRLLYNGKPPRGISEGPYPLQLKDANGKEVLLVYTGEHGQYVGNLALTFDQDGRVVKFDGNPKYMGSNVPEDPVALETLEKFRSDVEKYTTQVVGESRVYLESTCQKRECNLGNLLTDAFIHHRADQWAESKRKYWTDAAIAFVNAGNIKSPIAVKNKTVVLSELMESLPYNNILYAITVNGSVLKQVFEHSAQFMEEKGTPRFLQVAGLHVIYDIGRKPKERVVSLRARCAECETPFYEDVQDDKLYKAVTIEYLTEGGDDYPFIGAQLEEVRGGPELDVLKKYFEFYKIVQIGNEERIRIWKTATLSRSGSVEYAKKNLSGNLLFLTCILYFYYYKFVFPMISILVSF